MSIFRDVVLPTIFSFVDEWAYLRHQDILISLSNLHRFCNNSKTIDMGKSFYDHEIVIVQKYITIKQVKSCGQEKGYIIQKTFHQDIVNYQNYQSYSSFFVMESHELAEVIVGPFEKKKYFQYFQYFLVLCNLLKKNKK
jgi:hypothetical protein